jgi:hypothetical protein
MFINRKESPMPKLTSSAKLRSAISAFCLLGIMVVACKYSSLPGAKMNMFEGSNAQDGAAKIKAKLGVDDVKVSSMEIHENRLEIIVQDPKKPKNYDKYTYEKGAVKGPEPVQAMVLGNQELTADKLPLFNLNDINLAATPDVCRKATLRAQIEDGKPDVISIEFDSASNTRSKEENEKKQAEMKKLDPLQQVRQPFSDLVPTWRIWIKGPRATKYFYADAKGNLSDH